MTLFFKQPLLGVLCVCAASLLAAPAWAELPIMPEEPEVQTNAPPPTLYDMQNWGDPTAAPSSPNNVSANKCRDPEGYDCTRHASAAAPKKSDEKDVFAEEEGLALQIRTDGMRDAATSYGARGGLAFRTRQIMARLDTNKGALEKTFDFRRLLIATSSNMLIEPPIIAESLEAFDVNANGDEAAVSDVIYNISRQARIVAAPRNWRQYLERTWDSVPPPPKILLPENDAERAAWKKWVAAGWQAGFAQADSIFQADLNRLTADFEGMVRYRVLLTQGKVSAPFAVLADRGVSGGGNQMRVGDRAIRLSGPAQLRPAGDSWQPPIQQ
jgi:defect-in-organelle-trafficking protein DotC